MARYLIVFADGQGVEHEGTLRFDLDGVTLRGVKNAEWLFVPYTSIRSITKREAS